MSGVGSKPVKLRLSRCFPVSPPIAEVGAGTSEPAKTDSAVYRFRGSAATAMKGGSRLRVLPGASRSAGGQPRMGLPEARLLD
jgi:hypothetical protein